MSESCCFVSLLLWRERRGRYRKIQILKGSIAFLLFVFFLFKMPVQKTSPWSTGNNWISSLLHKTRNECPFLQGCRCMAKTTLVEQIKSLHIPSSPLCWWRRTEPEGDASLSTAASHCWFATCKCSSVHTLNLLPKAKCFWNCYCWPVQGTVAWSTLAELP